MTLAPKHRDAALSQFVRRPVSRQMVSYLAEVASSVIRCEEVPPAASDYPTPPATPPNGDREELSGANQIPTVERFIAELVHRSQVQTATLMSTLVYLERLRARLPTVAKGGRCTVHRIFLACLILAAKNLNDSSPKNKHWAKYSYGSSIAPGAQPFGFSLTEVNLMERQLLCLLDFNLRITREDLLENFEPFLVPIVRRMEDKEREELEFAELEAERIRLEAERDRYRSHTRTVTRSRSPPIVAIDPSSLALPHYDLSRLSPAPSPAMDERRSSATSDCTHISTAYSRRDSSSSIEDYPDTPPSTRPGLTHSSAGSSIASSENSPVAPAYALPQIPLSALSGGPKGKKSRPGIFARFWPRDEDVKVQHARTETWVAGNEGVVYAADGRPMVA